jgi:hypothetical protein
MESFSVKANGTRSYHSLDVSENTMYGRIFASKDQKMTRRRNIQGGSNMTGTICV